MSATQPQLLSEDPEQFYAQAGLTLDQVAVEQVRGLLAQGFEGDCYRQAAADVLGIPPEQVTTEQRLRVKRACFAHFNGARA